MSDFPQGDEWWKASDDRWYAPPATADGQPPDEGPASSVAEKAARSAKEVKAADEATMKKGCLWIVGVIVAITVVATIAGWGDDEPASGSQAGAFDVCTKFVEDRLRAPGTARFRNFHEDDGEVRITGAGDGPYIVSSSVDSENGFGASIRTDFVCQVRHTGDGNYRLIDISMG